MRKAHRWPLASSAASLVVLAFAASAAAQSNNEAVNACRQIADAEARITCLEAALMARDTAPAITAPEPAPSTSATSIPAATEQDAENDTGRGWIRIPVLPRFGRRGAGEGAPQVASDTPAAEGLGAEQVNARAQSRSTAPPAAPVRVAANIVEHDIHGYAQLEVVLDNGQVWRQRQGDRQRVRLHGDGPFPVEIFEARSGGYRMKLIEQYYTIVVERLR